MGTGLAEVGVGPGIAADSVSRSEQGCVDEKKTYKMKIFWNLDQVLGWILLATGVFSGRLAARTGGNNEGIDTVITARSVKAPGKECIEGMECDRIEV